MPSILPLLARFTGGQTAGIVIGSIFGAALLGVGIFFLVVYLYRRRCRKVFRDLEKDYQEAMGAIKDGCQPDIRRLKTIGEKSEDFRLKGEECEARQQRILQREAELAATNITAVRIQLQKRNYRGIGNSLNEARSTLENLKRETESFRQALKSYLAKDTEFHKSLCQARETLVKFKEFCQDHSADLVYVQPVLDYVFSGLNNQFEEFEVLLDAADYEAAQKLFDGIAQVVNALSTYGVQLPDIIAAANSVLPSQLRSLYLEYRHMVAEEIPLEHLDVENEIKGMADQIQQVRKNLASLDIGHSMDELNAIRQHILQLRNAFKAEVEAKEALKSHPVDFAQKLYEVQLAARDLNQTYAAQRSRYVIAADRISELEALPERISDVEKSTALYSELANATIPQPFTALLDKSQQLGRDLEDIISTIAELRDYLKGLDSDAEDMRVSTVVLLKRLYQIRYQARKTGPGPYLREIYGRCEAYLNSIDQFSAHLDSVPCDTIRCNEEYARIDKQIEELAQSVQEQINACSRAETYLIQLNQYRTDCLKEILICEDIFNEGRFSEAAHKAEELLATCLSAVQSQTEFAPLQ